MVCNTLRAAASVLAEHMATKRDQSISVNVMPEVIRGGSVLHEVCVADPRLILCIKTLQLQVEDYGLWAKLIIQVEYTNTLSSSVVRVESISELREATIYAASLHRRDLLIVYPAHLHEQIQGKKSNLLESHQLLNCYVSGLSSEIKRMEECRYMAQVIHFQYSCSYRELTDRKAKITEKINEIVRQAKLSGIEDWRKAYAVVRYCVNNWHYGRIENSPKLEYTAYSAIINNTAVCMGISLAICSIFKELGIPCRYVRGTRNGEGHAWNMVFLCGGWFYIDVTDAICRKDPLYHWGMVHLLDRSIFESSSEVLSCNCTPEFIRKMTC